LATTVYLSADLITAATDACVGALRPYARYDWHGTKAADLEWSCWDTALHVADDLYFYALQLIYGPPDRDHLPTELALEDAATVTRVLDAIPAHGELLRRTVLSAGRDDRAYHVYGVSDPEGFAAMGVAETLVHTYDLARGLDSGTTWRPPPELAVPVLQRLFPAAPEGDPTGVLLYCCGRAPLGHRPRQETWRWDGRIRD